jgi:hypothetical protein
MNLGYVSRGATLFQRWSDFWDIIVEQYTERKLTVKDDRLIALAAVAEEYGNRDNREMGESVQYLAGLWRPTIEQMWMWRYTDSSNNRRPKKYRAPTWSWASVDSPYSLKFLRFELGGIVDVETTPLLASLPYGNAQSGFMRLQCNPGWFFLKRNMQDFRPYLTSRKDDQTNPFKKEKNCFVTLDAPEDDFVGWKSPGVLEYRVWMILSKWQYGILCYGGLLLKKVRGEAETYRRVGVCRISRELRGDDGYTLLSVFDSASPRTIIVK